MRSEIVIRFDYGSILPWVRNVDGTRLAIAGPDAVAFRTPVPLRGENMRTVGEFDVAEGERVPFVLTWYPSHEDPPRAIDAEHALRDTEEYWRDWAAQCEHMHEWHEDVHRSLLTLKALTYAPTGGIRRRADNVAAGAHRRAAQLGLSLLLAPRCDVDAARDAARGLHGRGPPVAHLAAARGRRRSG